LKSSTKSWKNLEPRSFQPQASQLSKACRRPRSSRPNLVSAPLWPRNFLRMQHSQCLREPHRHALPQSTTNLNALRTTYQSVPRCPTHKKAALLKLQGSWFSRLKEFRGQRLDWAWCNVRSGYRVGCGDRLVRASVAGSTSTVPALVGLGPAACGGWSVSGP
jgi:hypothetical protein